MSFFFNKKKFLGSGRGIVGLVYVTKKIQRHKKEKWRRDFLVKIDAEEYAKIDSKYFKRNQRLLHKTKHFANWAIKLLVPDFLVGHPNLWDNIKLLFKNPQFKPLRAAFVAWIIFTLVVGSTGIYALFTATSVKATTPLLLKTGYYWGTGTSQSITGLGFTPQMVIIKSESSSYVNAVWKSSAMPADEYGYISYATADNTDSQLSLDSDGFTVKINTDVNAANIRYIYIAYAGSDCSSNGVFCVGSYSGNNSLGTQDISTGFQPDLVWTKQTTATYGTFRTSAMSANSAAFFYNAADNVSGAYFTTLNAGGFTVGTSYNTNGGLFYYAAFKATAGVLSVGSYTGDGTASKTITGVGFVPNFVAVKGATAVYSVANITQSYGDDSVFFYGGNTQSAITKLQTDGFMVGNTTYTNTSSVVYRYFAFGGAAATNMSGSFTMKVGYYTGTGSAYTVSGVGFQPDLVMIKADTGANYGVWAPDSNLNFTNYFTSTTGLAGAITSFNSDGFVVGTDSNVNTISVSYEYMAFGNATTSQSGGHAADFVMGNYVGTGADNRVIDNLGITPDFVVIKSTGSAGSGVWRTSAMSSNTAAYFTNATENSDGTLIKSLDSANGGGFTLGSNATNTNNVGSYYQFFAFKKGASTFNVGTYTGNGGASQNITGAGAPGFQPDLVWVKAANNNYGVHRSSSSGISGANSQYFYNAANTTGMITGFLSDGFTVGNSATVNSNTIGYRWAAWKATAASGSQPTQPTNSSPANGSIGADLNSTLTGSAYSDPGSHAQTDANWQVATDNTFTFPVWTRTAGTAETSTTINSSNGTFANALAGKTALNHNTTYYWRVRYSNVTYSGWSVATSFTTNTISTPTNSSPSDATTVTSLTPTLTASAFFDAQTGHTAANAEWQINTANSFTTPLYDSGTVSYGTSLAVPSAILSDKVTYWWQVRYQDSSGQWSGYSTPTRFLVSNAILSIAPLFSNTIVNQGDSINIDVQIKLSDGTVVSDATAAIDIYNPSGAKIVSLQSMSYLSGSSGVYRYASYTVPSTSGSYLYQVTATQGAKTGYGAGNFQTKTIASDITTLNTNLNSANSTLGTVNTNLNTVNATLNTVNTNVNTVNNSLSAIGSTLAAANAQTKAGILNTQTTLKAGNTINIEYSARTGLVYPGAPQIYVYNPSNNGCILGANMTEMGNSGIYQYNLTIPAIGTTGCYGTGYYTILVSESTEGTHGNMQLYVGNNDLQSIGTNIDNLVGAFIVTQSSVNDSSPIATSFISALTNITNDFYKNSVLTFNSGALNGQVRRISGYNGTTKVITLDPALTSAPSNGDIFTIVKQDVRVQEQAVSIQSDITTIKSNVATLITEIGSGNISAIKTSTDTINWSNITGLVTTAGNIKSKTDLIDWTQVAAIKTSTDTINWGDVTGIKLKTNTIDWGDISNIKSNVATLITEIGSGNISAIKTSTDTINWSNITGLVTTAGNIKSKTDSIDWTQVAAIKTSTDTINWGDVTGIKLKTNTINWSDITSIQSDVSAIKSDVSYIKGKVDSINTLLGTVDTNLSSMQTAVNSIRTSQQKAYKATLSDIKDVQTGGTYRAKLTLLDYQDNPVDSAITPIITIYDSTRATVVSDQNMTETAPGSGIYEYNYPISSTAATGSWESIVTTAVASSSNQQLTDYFNVTGSPAQVTIDSISTTTPTIFANVKITNEGSGNFEYHYEWCVVADQTNQCGGNNDIDYGSDSKLVKTKESYTPTLTVTVPTAGTYWFKLVVYYGTQASGASRQFTATSSTVPPLVVTPGGGGGGSSYVQTLSVDALGLQIQEMQKTINLQSTSLAKVLSMLGIIKPSIETLLSTSGQQLNSVQDVQNKLADLKAISSSVQQIVTNNGASPVVQTYMKFNSVVISFLITNPSSTKQTVNFKAALPVEIKSGDIMNLDGLSTDYDTTANSYYVYGSISLSAKQSITKSVEMKDIWVFNQSDLDSIKKQTGSFSDALKNTQYLAQGILLKNNIEDLLIKIETSQKASYTSPQDHILAYRNNKLLLDQANTDFDQLKNLVVQSGASQGLVGKIGGIQTFATWGIILAIIFGFGLMGLIIFSMWRYQVVLATQVIDSNNRVLSRVRRKLKKN